MDILVLDYISKNSYLHYVFLIMIFSVQWGRSERNVSKMYSNWLNILLKVSVWYFKLYIHNSGIITVGHVQKVIKAMDTDKNMSTSSRICV